MFFDKKIKYLDYMENKERVRGVGFVKIEVWDNVCELHIQVNGMHGTDNFARKAFLVGEEKEAELCEITLEKGRGSIDVSKLDSQNLSGSGISYMQLYGIRIPIAAGKEIYCAVRERGAEKPQANDAVQAGGVQADEGRAGGVQANEGQADDAVQTHEVQAEDAVQADEGRAEDAAQAGEGQAEEKQATEVRQNENTPQESPVHMLTQEGESELQQEDNRQAEGVAQSEGRVQVEGAAQDIITRNIEEFVNKALQMRAQESDSQKVKGGDREIKAEAESPKPQVEEQENEERGQKAEASGQEALPTNKCLQESKWKQLTSIYPHVRPFRDERDYLSIGPGDFVVLTEKYYNMANNSFVLHGYYNYKHLILSRLEKRGNIAYYVGVPGNFYEKEKQVALLFGFESFECAKEPAQVGDYGYYMMKVEL